MLFWVDCDFGLLWLVALFVYEVWVLVGCVCWMCSYILLLFY